MLDLDQFCAALFYSLQPLILQAGKRTYLENGLYAYDSLGALPLALPPLLAVEKSFEEGSTSAEL